MEREALAEGATMPSTRQYWLRTAVAYLAAAVVITLVYSRVGFDTPWRRAVTAFAVSLTFSCCIGVTASWIMPRLASRLHERVTATTYWAAMVAALLAIAIAGSIVAICLLIGVGYIPARAFNDWFLGSLRISIAATLTFGLFATAYETLRARLEVATIALRTKERDEAEARRMAVEAQLASLESKVNPHFLFNTLNSIAALVHDDPAAAERMTTQLAALMRSSLDQDASLVTVDEELRLVRAYLEIERVRFGDRLRYDVTADEGAESARVPRLSVQTIVENSVKYAVTPQRAGGSIAVRAAAANGHLRIEVADDGPGFDAAALPEGHGLALVTARLAMAYGDRASLKISSRPGRTTVDIDVPMSSP
jgi:signal transduction histidine kinase